MTGRRFVLFFCVFSISFPTLLAQDDFKRVTHPQVLAGSNFDTSTILLNSTTSTCEYVVVAHQTAGSLASQVLVDGRAGGVRAGFLGPHSSVALPIESPDASYVGAVSVDQWTPECFNGLTVQTQTRVLTPSGALSEFFSYGTPLAITPGQCAVAAVQLDNDPSDGRVVIPGFASAGLEPLEDVQLCHRLKNSNGESVGEEVCGSTVGTHQARLLTDIFGQVTQDVALWQACLVGPRNAGSITPLFVDVVREGGLIQYDVNEHQIKATGCPEDSFNACLNDRFSVSVSYRQSPSGPDFPGRVGNLTADQSASFSFADPDQQQIAIIILDGCRINDHFWVFSSALSSVEYEVRVIDTLTGMSRSYGRTLDDLTTPIVDVEAFATCP